MAYHDKLSELENAYHRIKSRGDDLKCAPPPSWHSFTPNLSHPFYYHYRAIVRIGKHKNRKVDERLTDYKLNSIQRAGSVEEHTKNWTSGPELVCALDMARTHPRKCAKSVEGVYRIVSHSLKKEAKISDFGGVCVYFHCSSHYNLKYYVKAIWITMNWVRAPTPNQKWKWKRKRKQPKKENLGRLQMKE